MNFGIPAEDTLAARLFPPLPGTVRWGLDRTERMLSALNDPHRSYPVLHVGGTNGKGSVARLWAGILRAAGFRTGLYTSPHLVSFRERILVDGLPFPDPLLEEWSRDVRPLLLREAPSFFEAATVLAFHAFARAEVEVAVVEVGLGGRLDATNVVNPLVTAITNVAWDHADLLGGTLERIAREKAGILKPGVPAFTTCDDPALLAVLAEEAAIRGTPLRRVPLPTTRVGIDGSRLRIESGKWGGLELASPLCGEHQGRNIALAVRSLEALPPRLPVSAAAIREGILRTRVPGRFQLEVEGERHWIFDVAHNSHGVRAFVNTIGWARPPRPRIGVVGILADKGWREMLPTLLEVLDLLILVSPESAPADRRWDPQAALSTLPEGRGLGASSLGEAFEIARRESGLSGTVVVTGSTYTVGDGLRLRGRTPVEAMESSSEGE
jgi:dihydrofolate synthase/folylpolyglutamate synthase